MSSRTSSVTFQLLSSLIELGHYKTNSVTFQLLLNWVGSLQNQQYDITAISNLIDSGHCKTNSVAF